MSKPRKTERPILFNSDMVRAIMDRRKTQTRRVVKPQPPVEINSIKSSIVLDGSNREAFIYPDGDHYVKALYCPYGQKGDLLWVRETFVKLPFKCGKETGYRIAFPDQVIDSEKNPLPKKPSIHLPKSAARIWLRITNVRIERLHEITEQAAKEEGIFSKYSHLFKELRYQDYMEDDPEQFNYWRDPRSSFKSLWQKINGLESWEANHWVWVVEFEVLSTTGKPDYWTDKQLRVDEESERYEKEGSR